MVLTKVLKCVLFVHFNNFCEVVCFGCSTSIANLSIKT